MKKQIVFVVGLLLVMAMTWAALGQQRAGGFGRATREAQQKAIATIQEELGKLKAMMEQQPGAQGRNFQDMSEEERTKMREEFTKRREQQQKILTSIQQQVDTLKGAMALAQEHQQAMEPLQGLLASAKSENATATAAKIQQLIDQRQKQFGDKMAAMGYDQEALQRMMERMSQRRGQ